MKRLVALIPYATAVALSVLILILVMRLWRADPRIPIHYGWDSVFHVTVAQGVKEGGWYWTHSRLGAPGSGEWYDFPLTEGLHFGLLQILMWLGCDSFLAVNLHFYMMFPLVTLCTCLVLRTLGLDHLPCLVASLLYAFIPNHFLRNTQHLFLASYCLIPPAMLIALWVYLEPERLFCWSALRKGQLRGFFTKRSLLCIGILLLVASGALYFAFFTCFFLVVAGVASWAARGRVQPALTAATFVAIIVLGGLANLSPALIYVWRHGENKATHHGDFGGAERYAMKITQLVLPTPGHRVKALRELRARYDSTQEPSETCFSSLGLIGSIGFLALLAGLFCPRPLTGLARLEKGLVLLNIAGVLLATVGGFGSLLALLALPEIRSYNRMSFVLAFLSLLAFFLIFERVFANIKHGPWGKHLYRLILAAILVVGILDQVPRQYVPDYGALRAEFRKDREFMGRVEASLAPGSKVFQLPYWRFPEYHPEGTRMYDFDHFRGYLHSRTLCWSYGAIKGREIDKWQAEVASKPPEEMIRALIAAGFQGIYVDRYGFVDNGVQLESDLHRLLRTEPLRREDDRLLFFPLAGFSPGGKK